MFLHFAYIGMCLLSIVISFYVKAKFENFIEKNTTIANEKSLEDYKNIVRLNMYGALAQIVLFVGAFISGIVYILNQGFAGVFSFFLLWFAASVMKQLGQVEEKVRTLTCATAELERQYTKISHTWKKKAFPDF
ncbi:hypothetical protein IQ274_24515 [Nostoc sp. LEGE 12447]|uniref:hypothetical protein n=1 Tax=Nostoc sp. LEGE 12447 TaxID=1828640 RepID=UPI001883E8F9|nr:hypothetical protein [Nostoc sp. LEGE 12447]MBE9001296.1 hypothetical protein [Nostoc sp. LEGE 12447]